jgi:hypothetical protein
MICQKVVIVVIASLLIAVGMGLQFWNEGRAVQTASSLAEGTQTQNLSKIGLILDTVVYPRPCPGPKTLRPAGGHPGPASQSRDGCPQGDPYYLLRDNV